MKLPADTVIAPEKLTRYLLVRQPRNDKSGFLARAGYSLANADVLLADLRALAARNDAKLGDSNKYGHYYVIVGSLCGPNGVTLRVRTVWMTESLSNLTKFITLIPSD